MANPMLQMLSRAASPNSGGFSSGNFPIARLGEFMQLMRGRNPEQLVQNFIKANNVSEDQYRQVLSMAQDVCRTFGIK